MRFNIILRIVSLVIFLSGVLLGIFILFQKNETEVNIEWKTASELNTAGFNLYRSELPDGMPILISDKIILASFDPLKGGAYQYIDNDVEPGRSYRYKLEEVDVNGNISTLGEIQVLAKDYRPLEIIISILLMTIGLLGLWVFSKKNRRIENT